MDAFYFALASVSLEGGEKGLRFFFYNFIFFFKTFNVHTTRHLALLEHTLWLEHKKFSRRSEKVRVGRLVQEQTKNIDLYV